MIAILDYICLGFKANIRKDAGVVERGGLARCSYKERRDLRVSPFFIPFKLYNCTTFLIFVL